MYIAIVQALQTVRDLWHWKSQLYKHRTQKIPSLLFLGIVEREIEVCDGTSWLRSAVDASVLNDF